MKYIQSGFVFVLLILMVLSTSSEEVNSNQADFNSDGKVEVQDLLIFREVWQERTVIPTSSPIAPTQTTLPLESPTPAESPMGIPPFPDSPVPSATPTIEILESAIITPDPADMGVDAKSAEE